MFSWSRSRIERDDAFGEAPVRQPSYRPSSLNGNKIVTQSIAVKFDRRWRSLREYQISLLGEDNCVKASTSVFCETDEEAWLYARRGLEPAECVELWDQERFVIRGDALALHTWR